MATPASSKTIRQGSFFRCLSNSILLFLQTCCLPLLKVLILFPFFPYQILRKLEEREADLDRLQEMQEKDIGALIRYAPGGRVGLIISMFYPLYIFSFFWSNN